MTEPEVTSISPGTPEWEESEKALVDQRIREYEEEARNCECGNHCYKIVGGVPGKYEVEWAHDPAECPFECEDCEQEVD